MIEFTGEEILSYLDAIEKAGENMFQHLTTLHIDDPQYIQSGPYTLLKNLEQQTEYESTIISRILTGNNYRLKSIMINATELYMQFYMFESSVCSSITLLHLVEFSLWAELSAVWTLDELMILLRMMPALRRLSLNITARNADLLDGEQIRSVLSATNISHLDTFNYAVEYLGPSIEHGIIFNLPQKWLPQTIAFKFDSKCGKLEKELFATISIQQQQFYLTSLYIEGYYCGSAQLIELLITFESHLRKLHVAFDYLLNLINDVNNNTRLKTVMLHRYLVYLELNYIWESEVNSEDFSRVISFLVDNRNGLRHIKLFLVWHLEIFESIDDMKSLIKILSTFKHCKQLLSIVIYSCTFTNQSYKHGKTISLEHDFRNTTDLIFERNFHLECDSNNQVVQLWFEQITNNFQ
ncbi:unnamed protein product [Rotaria socialis]